MGRARPLRLSARPFRFSRLRLVCFSAVCIPCKDVIVRRVSLGACSAFRHVFGGVRVGVCCGRSWLRLGW